MLKVFFLVILCVPYFVCYPMEFATFNYKVGIEYEHSLPMSAGSERFRHINNYNPFFILVTATAKKGFVLDYIEVQASADIMAEVDFRVVHGKPGGQTMVFQISANQSDFLSYTYRAYGIREEDYSKVMMGDGGGSLSSQT